MRTSASSGSSRRAAHSSLLCASPARCRLDVQPRLSPAHLQSGRHNVCSAYLQLVPDRVARRLTGDQSIKSGRNRLSSVLM